MITGLSPVRAGGSARVGGPWTRPRFQAEVSGRRAPRAGSEQVGGAHDAHQHLPPVSTAADPREVRAAAAVAGGHATLIRGADKSSGVFTPVSDVLMRIHQGLKQAFDPTRVFNPGRLYAEL